jgi:hypothetical protein
MLFLAAAVSMPPMLSARSALVTTTAIQRLQPFIVMQTNWDTTATAGSGGVGGIVKYYVAKSTDTLKVCDLVAIDTLNAVTKSATLAAYNKLAGVVVGGRSTSMQASISSSDCGSTAALPNRPVIVLRTGRFWVQLDTTTGGVTAGGLLGPSAIAGKVRPKTSVIDSLYRVVGRSVLGGAISTTILAEISAR